MSKYQNVAKTKMATAIMLSASLEIRQLGQMQLAHMGLHYRTILNTKSSGVARSKRIARKRKNIRARTAK